MARRIVKAPGDRVLREALKLQSWVQKPDERRREYFVWCDVCEARIAALCGEDGLDDDAVVQGVAASLRVDDTFHAYVGEREGAEMLIDNQRWEQIVEVGARQIYYEYLVAKEKSEWP
jgi:hypothetical protein